MLPELFEIKCLSCASSAERFIDYRFRYNARQIQHPTSYASSVSLPTSTPSMPIAAQAQAYLEQNVRAYISPRKYSQVSGFHTASQNTVVNVAGRIFSLLRNPGRFARAVACVSALYSNALLLTLQEEGGQHSRTLAHTHTSQK